MSKISGPRLDRIDLHVEVTPVSYSELANDLPKEGSTEIRNRVIEARKIQTERYSINPQGIHNNSQMSSKDLKEFGQLDSDSQELLKNAMNRALRARFIAFFNFQF